MGVLISCDWVVLTILLNLGFGGPFFWLRHGGSCIYQWSRPRFHAA